MWDLKLDWYTFNVFTLVVQLVVAAINCFALWVWLEEKKGVKRREAALKRREEEFEKRTRLGRRL